MNGDMFSCALRKKNVTGFDSPPVSSQFFILNKPFFLKNKYRQDIASCQVFEREGEKGKES